MKFQPTRIISSLLFKRRLFAGTRWIRNCTQHLGACSFLPPASPAVVQPIVLTALTGLVSLSHLRRQPQRDVCVVWIRFCSVPACPLATRIYQHGTASWMPFGSLVGELCSVASPSTLGNFDVCSGSFAFGRDVEPFCFLALCVSSNRNERRRSYRFDKSAEGPTIVRHFVHILRHGLLFYFEVLFYKEKVYCDYALLQDAVHRMVHSGGVSLKVGNS